MMKRVELYGENALISERGRKRRTGIVMLIVLAIGLAACVVLCTFATRRNLKVLLPVTIGVSVLTGWIDITILHGAFGESNARVRHMNMMLTEPRETVRGRFEKTDDVTRMRNGMSIRKVRLTVEEQPERILSVNEALSDRLPDGFTGTAETVYAFIVAYEVDEDD